MIDYMIMFGIIYLIYILCHVSIFVNSFSKSPMHDKKDENILLIF